MSLWCLLLFFNCLGVLEGHLLVYSETHVDVFDVASGDWVQTINIKKARPLNTSGSLSVCVINDLTHIIYLSHVRQRKFLHLDLAVKLDRAGN